MLDGVNPQLPPSVSGRYISSSEREDIALWRAQGEGSPTNCSPSGPQPVDDLAGAAQERVNANLPTRVQSIDSSMACRASCSQAQGRKMVINGRLREYVQDRLSGEVHTTTGKVVGPDGPSWDGKNKPHRGDRAWVTGWSPEQISKRLPLDFPDDESMRISAEAIYQALYIEAVAGWSECNPGIYGEAGPNRMPRSRARQQTWAHVTADTVLAKRPKEVADRKLAGHWEGDLIIGLKRSAVATLIERTSRYAVLVHLPRQKGYGMIPPRKNGPALAGYGALTMKDALAKAVTPLPKTLRRSLTWDRGKELSAHALFTEQTGVPVYFADAKSPWQRGSNEHLNGLLRQYFPKGTDLSRWNSAGDHRSDERDQQPPPRESLIAHPRGGIRRIATICTTTHCCDDRLNTPNIRQLRSPTGSLRWVSMPRSGRLGRVNDNALAETINGLYMTELIKPRGPWRTVEHVEIATLEWVDWFNHRRLYEQLWGCASCELEAFYYGEHRTTRIAEFSNQ